MEPTSTYKFEILVLKRPIQVFYPCDSQNMNLSHPISNLRQCPKNIGEPLEGKRIPYRCSLYFDSYKLGADEDKIFGVSTKITNKRSMTHEI